MLYQQAAANSGATGSSGGSTGDGGAGPADEEVAEAEIVDEERGA
jgi:hypothetical protein